MFLHAENILSMGIGMSVEQRAANWIANFSESGAPLGHLPKNVRFLGQAPTQADPSSVGMYEFEVVTGNAAYREGERFYLTPSQAQRVYFVARQQGAELFDR
jgi:hypothetical protein